MLIRSYIKIHLLSHYLSVLKKIKYDIANSDLLWRRFCKKDY